MAEQKLYAINDVFLGAIERLRMLGFADSDISWAEGAGPPENAEVFACEAIFVICNSGMKNTVARQIYSRVIASLKRGESARAAFGHVGKSAAIDTIWRDQERLFAAYCSAEDKIAFCETLPWIGAITKFHLAKNFGVDVAKPDVHLARLGIAVGETPQALCERLGAAYGYKARTVDLLLWRACAEGVIDSRTGRLVEDTDGR